MLNTTVTTASPDRNPDRVTVRTRELAGLRESFAILRDMMYSDRIAGSHDIPFNVWMALGRAEAYVHACTEAVQDIDPSPDRLAIYCSPEPEPEPEGFIPTPEDERWAAENVRPCRAPQTSDGLLSLVADSLESIGLEPARQGDSLDFEALGRDWRLQLQDMTAFYDAMEREYREQHEPEAVMNAAGLLG